MYILTCKNCDNNILKVQKEFFETHTITTFRLIVEANNTKCCNKSSYEYCFIDKMIIAKKSYNVRKRLSKADLEKLVLKSSEKGVYKIIIKWIKDMIEVLLKFKPSDKS